MILKRDSDQTAPESPHVHIGLALSGGGFRASIFHLGVIRRLEELGIMKDVAVISAVSGGSIIAAYYVCQMEQRLRRLSHSEQHDRNARISLFEEIAQDFLKALDHNLRSRAIIFTPYYHPWLFIKTLVSRPFRTGARAELIQAEYDRWFYDGNTLDELPSVTPERVGTECTLLYGPKLVLNTTSLLTGQRVPFSREPVSALKELSKVNTNVLPLAKVVGASAGVPVLFPPTTISGDVLVDGGVCDNQGVEALINDDLKCDMLLVSDACGQMEQADSIGAGELTVFSRVNSILQFQVRAKVLEIMVAWSKLLDTRSFAFVHLFLNLKDRPNVPRISSEFITMIARLRTDLDQFSYIEREALMYHGYTLIDAQVQLYCKDLVNERFPKGDVPPLCVPPLFQDKPQHTPESRKLIREDLEVGCEGVYLVRCLKKYPAVIGPVLAITSASALALMILLCMLNYPIEKTEWLIGKMIYGVIPSAAVKYIDVGMKTMHMTTLGQTIRGLSGILALLILFGLCIYAVLWPAYLVVRRLTLARDLAAYRKITGGRDPSTKWDVPVASQDEEPKKSTAATAP